MPGPGPKSDSTGTPREEGREIGERGSFRTRTLVVGGCLGLGILAGIATLYLVPAPSSFPPGLGYPPRDFPYIFAAVTILGMLDVVLLAALSALYWTTYRGVRSPFTLGLAVVFSVLFLGAVLVSPLAFDSLRMGLAPGLRYPLYSVTVGLETLAFALLLYFSV